MKKKLFFSFLLISSSLLFAQEEYNKLSFGVNAGLNKATEHFTDGYTQAQVLDFESLSFTAHVRYMFNDKFGLKLDGGLSDLPIDGPSGEVNSTFSRVGLSAVANIGAVLGFREWTNRFNLLGHAGYNLGMLSTDFTDGTDYLSGASIGFTPQVRLTDWMSLNVDVSFFAYEGAKTSWDGLTPQSFRDFDARMYTASVGLEFYPGSKDKHADWVDASDKKELQEEIDDLENRLTTLEEDLKDDDKDGIPNYLDTEPNTPSGVIVDAKGRSIDENNNGVPDEMEAPLSDMFVRVDGSNNEEYQKSSGGGDAKLVKRLINEGYINVYFDFDSVQPSVSSYDAVHFIRNYMLVNTDVNAELVGYADELGDDGYNQSLSEQRAKRVYDILVSSGISEERLDYKGSGVDNSVDKNSSSARKVVRKVTFKIK